MIKTLRFRYKKPLVKLTSGFYLCFHILYAEKNLFKYTSGAVSETLLPAGRQQALIHAQKMVKKIHVSLLSPACYKQIEIGKFQIKALTNIKIGEMPFVHINAITQAEIMPNHFIQTAFITGPEQQRH